MSDTEPSVKGTRNVPPLQLEALRAGTIYNKSSSGSAPVVSKKKWLAKWSQEDADRQRLPNFNPFQEAAGQATSNVGGKSHVNGMSLCSSAPRSDLEVFRASALRNTTERCSITLGAGLASDTMAAHVEMQMQVSSAGTYSQMSGLSLTTRSILGTVTALVPMCCANMLCLGMMATTEHGDIALRA